MTWVRDLRMLLNHPVRQAHHIFSDLNSLNDISMMSEFSGICGVTVDKLHEYFDAGVEAFAEKTGRTVEEMYEMVGSIYRLSVPEAEPNMA